MNHREMIRRRGAVDGRAPVETMKLTDGGVRPSIELRIEHLVLDGFSSADRASIADAVKSELAGLLGEYGLPSAIQNSSELERLNGGTISLARGARAAAIGGQIAHAVHRGFINGQSENLHGNPALPNSAIPAKR